MDSGTSATLLGRLRNGDDAVAWQAFFNRYWRAVYVFARRLGCSAQTADDVVQDVMLTVFEKRDVFRYDPSRGRFRNWLHAVARQRIVSRHRKRKREKHGRRGIDDVDLTDEDARGPDAAWQEAFEQSLLAALCDVVRREVEPATWQAFELTALHDTPAAEAADLTGLSRNAVYLARKRVLARLRQHGAAYRDEGELSTRVKAAFADLPGATVERALTGRVETALTSRREAEGA